MALINGNNNSLNSWKTILPILQTIALPLLGWLLVTSVTLSSRVASLETNNESLWKWIQAEQQSDEKWKTEEHQYDTSVRELIDRQTSKVQDASERRDKELYDAIQKMNDKINSVMMVKGSSGPP